RLEKSCGWSVTYTCEANITFFFQAEDGIRDRTVTGVQTCALPIYGSDDDTERRARAAGAEVRRHPANAGKGAAIVTGLRALEAAGVGRAVTLDADGQHLATQIPARSEERRVGKECRGAGGACEDEE